MKKIINSDSGPAPAGPYNHSVAAGNILFVSGQVAVNPESGKLETDSIEHETHIALKNVGAILKAAGLEYADIVKCSVFVSDMNNYSRINAVYAKYFDSETAPARELVQVARLPLDANIEISVIALIPKP